MNSATYDEITILKNGQEVRIRAIRPADKGLVMEMPRNLDFVKPETCNHKKFAGSFAK